MPYYLCSSCNKKTLLHKALRLKAQHPCGCGAVLTRADYAYIFSTPMSALKGVGKTPIGKAKPKLAALPGRAHAAPPLTSWPVNGQNADVVYVADIATAVGWGTNAKTIYLPFRQLDTAVLTVGGLAITHQGADRNATLRAHFDACTAVMAKGTSNSRHITEAVGEAAAALAVLRTAAFGAFQMVWGFDTHSGAGIDQIWEKADPNAPEYLIVEAKGPNATLTYSPFTPSGYNQMEKHWVMDRLKSMLGNATSAPLATRIFNDLNLTPVQDVVASTNQYSPLFKAAKKNPLGVAKGTLHLKVITAGWAADGNLVAGVTTVGHTYP